MKPSTKLCKLLVLLCEAHNEKHPKKRKYTKRATKPIVKVKRKYTKRVEVIAPITVVKRGPGRPRKVQPIDASPNSNTTHPNKLNLTPEQQAKIDEIKKKIAALSATLPSDRGE